MRTPTPRTRITEGAGKLVEVDDGGALDPMPGEHKCFRTESGCTVICGIEPAKAAPAGIWLPEAALNLWHVSVSGPGRYPTWDEIADVRYELIPDDVTMAMLLPPEADYVNANEFCLHLWQIDDRRDHRW